MDDVLELLGIVIVCLIVFFGLFGVPLIIVGYTIFKIFELFV